MNWEKEFEKEFRQNAYYKIEDPKNCNRINFYYCDEYVRWLEDKLDSLIKKQAPDTTPQCTCYSDSLFFKNSFGCPYHGTERHGKSKPK